MPILPSVAHSYKHPILYITAVSPRFLNISLDLTLRIYYYYFVYILPFLNTFKNFVYKVTDALRKSFVL
jgi:hypothetical protein